MSGNTDGPSAQCSSCGATVHGQPGAMKCPYCGMRVDIPMGPAQRPAAILPDDTEEERRRARRHDMYEDADDDKPSVSTSGSGSIIIVMVVVGIVAVIVAIALASGHKKSKTSSTSAERKSQTTTRTTANAPPKPASFESILVSSCRCAFGDGQSTPLITLTPLAAPTQDPTRALSLRIESKNGFVSSSSSSMLALPPGTALTPLDGGDLPPHMGVACDTGYYVLVVDRVATGWSSVNARWKWNATLPASLVDGADASAPPQLKNTDFGGYCTPLTVQNGNASLALAGGKHVSLSIKDGKVH